MTASTKTSTSVAITLEMTQEEVERLDNILWMASEHLLLDAEDHSIINTIRIVLPMKGGGNG